MGAQRAGRGEVPRVGVLVTAHQVGQQPDGDRGLPAAGSAVDGDHRARAAVAGPVYRGTDTQVCIQLVADECERRCSLQRGANMVQ
jgi:hypothetical protein